MTSWQPINTAPLETPVLLWWRPVGENKFAEACVIGTVSVHMAGEWWNGQTGTYQDLWHVTHWTPLPDGPEERR